MTEGTAAVWREQYLDTITNDLGVYDFPAYEDFLKTLRTFFKDTDTKANALYKLSQAIQGKNSIEQHNAYFNLLISKSRLNVNDNYEVLKNYYLKSLNDDLLRAVWMLRPAPNTIEDWFQAAQNEDNN